MLTPGAVTSGLSQLSPARAPKDEKLANERYPGFASVVALSVTVVPSAASMAPSVVLGTPRNGIVTSSGSWLSGFSVIFPSKGGKDGALLTMSTAAAPARWPKTARATRAHVPRLVITSIPAVPAYSLWLQPREIAPDEVFSTFTGSGPLGSEASLALIAS